MVQQSNQIIKEKFMYIFWILEEAWVQFYSFSSLL